MRYYEFALNEVVIQGRQISGDFDLEFDPNSGKNPAFGSKIQWTPFGQTVKGKKDVGTSQEFLFPQSGKFTNPDEMKAAISDFERSGDRTRNLSPGKIFWVNNSSPTDKVFRISQIYDADNPNAKFWIGKFGSESITNKDLNTNYGYMQRRGDSGDENASSVLRLSLKPTDIFGSDNLGPFTSSQILEFVDKKYSAKYGDTLTSMISQAMKGISPITVSIPIHRQLADKELNNSLRQIEVNFMEVVQPIVLVSGKGYSGKKFDIPPESTITYTAGSAEIFDSIITQPGGSEIKVSSKKGEGAANVIGNGYLEVLQELPDEIKEKYQKEYQLISFIANSPGRTQVSEENLGFLEAVLLLPKEVLDIDREDIMFFLKEFKPNAERSFSDFSSDFWSEVKQLHPKLFNLIHGSKKKSAKDSPYYLTLNQIMSTFKNHVNETYRISDFMNYLFMMKGVTFVYTHPSSSVKQSGDGFTLDVNVEFEAHRNDSTADFTIIYQLLTSETFTPSGTGGDSRIKWQGGHKGGSTRAPANIYTSTKTQYDDLQKAVAQAKQLASNIKSKSLAKSAKKIDDRLSALASYLSKPHVLLKDIKKAKKLMADASSLLEQMMATA